MDSVNHCIAIFQNAIELENAGLLQDAVDKYTSGINELSLLLPSITDSALKGQCIDALKMYEDRVQVLQSQLHATFPSLSPQCNLPSIPSRGSGTAPVAPQQQAPNTTYDTGYNSTYGTTQSMIDKLEYETEPKYYIVSDSKDFNGQVDEIIQQVYNDINNEQKECQPQPKSWTRKPPPSSLQGVHTTQPVQSHPSLQRPSSPSAQQNKVNQQISELEEYLESEDDQDNTPMTQKDRDAIYKSAMDIGQQSLDDYKRTQRMAERIARQGDRAEKRIQNEQRKFNKMARQTHYIDDALNIK